MSRSPLLGVLLATAILVGGPLAPVAMADEPANPSSKRDYGVEADLINVFYAPGKAIVCGATGILGTLELALTFGAAYEDAARLIKGGCGGRWTVGSEDLRKLDTDFGGQATTD